MYKYLILKILPVSPSSITEIMHSSLARSGLVGFFSLQATRDTFWNWGLHLCAPTFVHLLSGELSSAHVNTGNIAACFHVLPPNTKQRWSALSADGFPGTKFPPESFQKWFIWVAKLPGPLKQCSSSIPSLAWGHRSQHSYGILPVIILFLSLSIDIAWTLTSGSVPEHGNAGHKFSIHLWIWITSSSFSSWLESGSQYNRSIFSDEDG